TQRDWRCPKRLSPRLSWARSARTVGTAVAIAVHRRAFGAPERQLSMQDDFRKKLIADHMEMAVAIASECVLKFNLSSLLPYADVVAYAQQGLVEAANRYSPQCGTHFRSYSWPRIKGAVIDGVRKHKRYGFSRTFGPADREHDPYDGPAPKATTSDVEAI